MSETEPAGGGPDRPSVGTRRRRVEATVRGHVQGVGFRWFVQRLAARLELTGWVANSPDGAVRVVAEGTQDDIEELLVAVRSGPPSASVSSVETQWTEPTGADRGFAIRSGGHTGD
jgi:acylphosphatase